MAHHLLLEPYFRRYESERRAKGVDPNNIKYYMNPQVANFEVPITWSDPTVGNETEAPVSATFADNNETDADTAFTINQNIGWATMYQWEVETCLEDAYPDKDVGMPNYFIYPYPVYGFPPIQVISMAAPNIVTLNMPFSPSGPYIVQVNVPAHTHTEAYLVAVYVSMTIIFKVLWRYVGSCGFFWQQDHLPTGTTTITDSILHGIGEIMTPYVEELSQKGIYVTVVNDTTIEAATYVVFTGNLFKRWDVNVKHVPLP